MAITITENPVPAMSDPTPAQQLGSFLAKFDPRVAASARAALARLRGTQARHIVLTDLKILEQSAVKKLMALALK